MIQNKLVKLEKENKNVISKSKRTHYSCSYLLKLFNLTEKELQDILHYLVAQGYII